MIYLVFICLLFYFLSSPFLFVCGDDRVIRYTEQMLIQVVLRMFRWRS